MKTTRVRVEGFTISLDGYGAGPNQDIRNPLGVGGTDLHQWLVPTRTLQRTLFGADGGTTGIDDDFAARGFKNVGAWILGRNMFGPIRGSWPDMNWKGWWGDNPPYHVPTFILTHHARPPIQMEGETTFHFVTGGIHEALDRARDAANGMDVRIGGGPNTIQQYLRAGLIDDRCTSLSRRSCWAGESDCSRGLTCALWDTNAFSSLRRRKPPMLYFGAKGTMTPNNRLPRTALPRRR